MSIRGSEPIPNGNLDRTSETKSPEVTRKTITRRNQGGFKIVGTSDLIERGSGRNKFKQIPEWFKALKARVEDAIITAVAQPGESNVQPTSRRLTPVQSQGQFPHK